MKNIVGKIVLALIIALTVFGSTFSQSYTSNKQTVLIADGKQVHVPQDRILYIQVWLKTSSMGRLNDIGNIWITNAHRLQDYKNVTYEEAFTIYRIDHIDDGTSHHWTKDNATKQIVLFVFDPNGTVSLITMSRYAPGGGSNIVKRVRYHLDQ